MVLLPYRALNLKKQNYIHISAATSSVSVGDRLSLNVKIVTDEQTAKVFSANHITYLVRPELPFLLGREMFKHVCTKRRTILNS